MIDTTLRAVERFTEQAQHALDRANTVRLARAEFQVDHLRGQSMEAGMLACADLLRNPPKWADTLAVSKLLIWIPRFGGKRVPALMRAVGIGELRQIGQLTERQRNVLADMLMCHAARTAESR